MNIYKIAIVKLFKVVSVAIAIIFSVNKNYAKAENYIRLESVKSQADVNRCLFGANFLSYDPSRECVDNWAKGYKGFSNFGSGLWDSKKKSPTLTVSEYVKMSRLGVGRFPGGAAVKNYDWKETVDPNRKDFLFGVDEFISFCLTFNIQPIVTTSYFTGTENDAADLVEYLNSLPDDQHEWARKRAVYGKKDPYNVKYFEIGNETYHKRYKILPEDYGFKYVKYYNAMKTEDQNIQIGVVLDTYEWNSRVLEIIKNRIDFGILHIYPTPAWGKGIATLSAKEIYEISLALPTINEEPHIQRTLKLIKEKAGKDVPIAVTEFNGGFPENEPVPYRHCLGTALLNAELLRIFMKPENNILMACYWNFCNEYWGMIANGFDGTYKTLYNPYYKRPSYYVYEMYAKHFGDILVDVAVKSATYDMRMYKPYIKSFLKRIVAGTIIKPNLLPDAWQINLVDGIVTSEKSGILEVDFKNPVAFNYYHATKKAKIEPKAYYKLSGYIKTDSLEANRGISLEIQDGRGWTKTKSAENTETFTGTNDWTYVETIYETLPDADSVTVIARRIGDKGPLKGKAYFKDVRLEKFVPDLDMWKIPYLSVNASKSRDGKKIYLMVINKNMEKVETATIELKDFIPATQANAWVLNGPSVDATNEVKHDNVKVTHKTINIAGSKFEYTFEPHSLTAIEIDKQ